MHPPNIIHGKNHDARAGARDAPARGGADLTTENPEDAAAFWADWIKAGKGGPRDPAILRQIVELGLMTREELQEAGQEV